MGTYVLDGDPAPPLQKGGGTAAPPQFSAHVLCPNGWMDQFKMPLGTEVGLRPGHIVFDGDPAHPKRGTSPEFSAHVCCGQTVAHLSYC